MTIAEWKKSLDDRPRIMCLADLSKYPACPAVVRIDGEYFELLDEGSGYWYPVAFSRCDSGPKLVEWVAHLLAKTWVTKEHMGQFIEAVTKVHPQVREFGC